MRTKAERMCHRKRRSRNKLRREIDACDVYYSHSSADFSVFRVQPFLVCLDRKKLSTAPGKHTDQSWLPRCFPGHRLLVYSLDTFRTERIRLRATCALCERELLCRRSRDFEVWKPTDCDSNRRGCPGRCLEFDRKRVHAVKWTSNSDVRCRVASHDQQHQQQPHGLDEPRQTKYQKTPRQSAVYPQ